MEDNKKTENKKAVPGKEKGKAQDKKRYWGKRGPGQKGDNKKNVNKADSDRSLSGRGSSEKKEGKKAGNKRPSGKKDQKKKKTGRRPDTAPAADTVVIKEETISKFLMVQTEQESFLPEDGEMNALIMEEVEDRDIYLEEKSTAPEPVEDTPEKDNRPKAKVIGVRFRDNGKIYYFSAESITVTAGDNVIVETARGVEYGSVVFGIREIEETRITSTLKPVIRIAMPKDDQIHKENIQKSKDAYQICLEKIKKHELEMKLIDCEYTFDNNKVLFYFTADGRIDFRELVKDLAAVFKTRIELRQIGVRDETKIKGGIGICGRELCCNTFLSDFIPVSIKMAKEQNLSLNPTKISGVCGRLMCCLKNEQDTYEYLNKKMPNNGDEVQLPDGRKGVVQGMNVLRQKVRVIITDEKDEKELLEVDVKDLTFYPRKKKDKDKEKVKVDGELKKLETFEKKDRKNKLS